MATAPVARQVCVPVSCGIAHIDCSYCGASSRDCRNVAARRFAMHCGRGVVSLLLSSCKRWLVPLQGSRCAPPAAPLPRHHGWALLWKVLRIDEDKYNAQGHLEDLAPFG